MRYHCATQALTIDGNEKFLLFEVIKQGCALGCSSPFLNFNLEKQQATMWNGTQF
jgi:hypothetical protein